MNEEWLYTGKYRDDGVTAGAYFVGLNYQGKVLTSQGGKLTQGGGKSLRSLVTIISNIL